MALLTRRHILQSTAPVVGVGVAGCTGLEAFASSPPTVELLEVENENPEPHSVSALLTSEGDPIFADTVEIDPYDSETNTLQTARFEGVPTDEPADTLYAWRDGQPREDWYESDLTQTDNECENLYIRIRNKETVPGEPLTVRHSLVGCDGPN